MIRTALLEIRSSLRRVPRVALAILRRRYLLREYLSRSSSPKLHIGCGPHRLEGWLNTDVDTSQAAIYLDATARFPFAPNTFEFIFSEHMIEHIPIAAAEGFLSECARVLKPNGVLRIATPDMAFLFELWKDNNSPRNISYVQNAARHFRNFPPISNTCTTINNFFYNWGHCFIYDEESLITLIKRSGLNSVERMRVGKSKHPALQSLEKHGLSISDKFNDFETMVLEASKTDVASQAG